MFTRLQRFSQSPMGRRVIMWLAPLIVGWVLKKLSGNSTSKTQGRKKVKNRAE